MFEVVIAALIVVALVLAAMIPPMTLLWIGVILGTLGALLGVPAGLVYHARLWKALRAEGHGTEGMWLRPHHLHAKVSEDRLAPIEAWFAAGVVGFAMTMLGAVGVVSGVVRFAAM